MNFSEVPKKTQLICLDSTNITSGTVSDCVIDLKHPDSKIFLENSTDIIGVRLIDYHVANLRGNVSAGSYVIDVLIDEVPTRVRYLIRPMGRYLQGYQ